MFLTIEILEHTLLVSAEQEPSIRSKIHKQAYSLSSVWKTEMLVL